MGKEAVVQKCDICDNPATNASRDILRHEEYTKSFAEFSPLGPVKFGCDLHPTTSKEYLTHLPRGKE